MEVNQQQQQEEVQQQQQRTSFVEPQKKIISQAKLQQFLQSQTCQIYLQFLEKLNESVKSKSNLYQCVVSEINVKLQDLIAQLSLYIDETPPVSHPGRFANPAYRTWFDKMATNADSLVQQILPDNLKSASVELSAYLSSSFGDRQRCDYGTGHETNFAVFLCCMDRLGLFKEEDYTVLVTKVFLSYIAFMRKLQMTYMLEPAGSKGVHSLDDFHFLIFYFGSSQLRGHPDIIPSSIRSNKICETYENEYMYLAAIRWINKVKTGPFFEHSCTLDGIANVPHWEKVNQGMMKMYKGEILAKFPVMQHFKFGSLLPFE